MSVPPVIVSSLGVLGLLIGSFLNVVIHRVPRGESLLFPPSRCPACDTRIKMRHNSPVFGWLWLRGKCAACRVPISARYPLVELGTGVLFAAFTVRLGLSAYLPAFLYLAAIAVALALIDVDAHHLPDSILLPSYVMGVLLLMPAGANLGDWRAAERAVIGLAVLITIYVSLALAYPRAINFGVIKLAGLLGMFLGWLSWESLLVGTFGGIVIAASAGLASSVTSRRIGASPLPVGLFMLTGAVLAVFVTTPVVHWYNSVFHLA